MREMYGRGATLQEIGDRIGLTKERVRQLIDQYGIEKRTRAQRLYAASFPARAEEVEALFLELRSDAEVAAATGIPLASVKQFVNSVIPDPGVLRRKKRQRFVRYTDEEFVECLRSGERALGAPLSHAAYAEWTRGRTLADGRPWPGPQGMMLRFGSWRNTLARAGLAANPTAGPDPQFELSDAVDAMVRAWNETGTPPTVDAYDRWRDGREGFPASATARKFVDGWDDLCLAAWPLVHGRPLPGIRSQEVTGHDQGTSATTSGGGPYRRASDDTTLAQSDPFERDPQELERSLNTHNRLQNRLADLADESGCAPLSPLTLDPEFDLAWRLPDGSICIVEVKSATPSNVESQLRIGLGQVLRYGERLRAAGNVVHHVMAIELQPPDEDWLSLLDRLDVRLVTPENLGGAFAEW